MADWLAWPGRVWRIVATAIAFVSFGVGGVLLWLVVFPLQALLLPDPARRQWAARTVVQAVFRLFVGWMRLLGLIDYEVRGVEKLQRRGLLILANHPTLIDVAFLIGLVPNASCVVKSTLADHPCTRGPVRATGYICNNPDTDLLRGCIDALAAGSNLIIFPEGTRSRPGQALKIQRGAAQIALRGGLDITPVRIHCEPLGLYKGQPWWAVAKRKLCFTIEVGDDLPSAPVLVAAGGEHGRAARRLTESLSQFFSQPMRASTEKLKGSHASAGTRNQGTADLGTPT
ncbi:lysophospholipid acyltransferase family protein [Roseateles asaccharophilus]|uniref:1-acyl-sn-glycerol-3-phosphate acyltransferase n=1 Tax=Roseateles asaccharophilus TaxID=582607 RepID=A0ABU2A6E7_9BURK|nr:lysophospholipid acyltransferase family protein [Roseateles asaccharophilus]MDR7332779.1 1-acyl-sn-glycerol-3-phosphate acyltransferase [Roseateles asaccharophilus]